LIVGAADKPLKTVAEIAEHQRMSTLNLYWYFGVVNWFYAYARL